MNLDDIRARRWGFAVYALDPSDPVTLEIHADGAVFSWARATVAECLVAAFGPVVSQTPPVAARAERVVAAEPEAASMPTQGRLAGGVAETTGGVFD